MRRLLPLTIPKREAPSLPKEPYPLDAILQHPTDTNSQKAVALKLFLYIGMSILFPFSLINYFFFGHKELALLEFMVAVVNVALLFQIRSDYHYAMISRIVVAITGGALIVILLALPTEESTLIWAGIFPVIAFYLLGHREGLIAHVVFSLIFFGGLALGWHSSTYQVTLFTLGNVLGALVVFGLFVYFYETNRDKALHLLFHHSISDELTGAGNRKLFTLLLQKEKAFARRSRHPLSLIMVDLDHFKEVNDRFGHIVGDQVLIAFSELIAAQLRRSDQLFRWGGEEFIILLPDTTADQAYTLAEKLRRVVEQHSFDPLERLTASFGVTQAHPSESDTETIRRLDDVLYRAKANGRNRVEKG